MACSQALNKIMLKLYAVQTVPSSDEIQNSVHYYIKVLKQETSKKQAKDNKLLQITEINL
jgi:hypothetical protein